MTTDTSQNSLLEAAKSFAISHINATDITAAGTMMQEAAAKMGGKPTDKRQASENTGDT